MSRRTSALSLLLSKDPYLNPGLCLGPYARVAQSVEHRPFKAGVMGSNPFTRTTQFKTRRSAGRGIGVSALTGRRNYFWMIL